MPQTKLYVYPPYQASLNSNCCSVKLKVKRTKTYFLMKSWILKDNSCKLFNVSG